MSYTTVLITRANRGLGKGFLQCYAARENHIVIAANRDPEHPASKTLKGLPIGKGSRLNVIKLDASVEFDATAAVQEVVATQQIDHLDIVIANAGIAYGYPTASELKTSDLLARYNAAFEKVCEPKAGDNGFLRGMAPLSIYLQLVTIWIQPDMGNTSACFLGFQEAPDGIDKSCDGIVKVIGVAAKQTHGGKIQSYEGKQQAW
ncbi:NAD(P)-binding protein [Hypoxylon sp. FL0890]|nr:NAD(P)-binding protein [Hypoxylon sp. FL0890]